MLNFDKHWWQYALIALSVLFFWSYLFIYAVNVPWFDDVEVFPGTLVIWLQSDLLGGITELFRPNNEHRMLPGKLAGVLCYELTGQLNMRWLALAANLNLMGIIVLFWRVFQRFNLTPLYFLPVCLVLLQPQFYLASTWSITAWQHQSVLFWGFLTMYLLSRNTFKTYLGAILSGFITAFCMSNGLLFWVAGAVVLGFQKRFRYVMGWLVGMGVAVFLYFYNFNNTANANGLSYFFAHPHESFLGFFTFFGGAFDFWQLSPIVKRAILPTVAGAILVAFCGWWLVGFMLKIISKNSPLNKPDPARFFLFGCLVFLFGNGFIIALLRPQFGYYVMLVGNYKLYPALLLAFSYLIFISDSTPKPLLWRGILAFCVVFGVVSYVKFIPDVAQRRQMLLAGAYNQQYNDIGLAAQINTTFADYTKHQMTVLSTQKAYIYPSVFNESVINKPIQDQQFMANVLVEGTPKTSVVVTQPDFENGDYAHDAAYVVLKSPTKTYLTATKQLYFAGRNPLRKPKGFSAELLPKFYQPDTYQIGVLIVSRSVQTFYKTDQRVLVDF